MLDGKRDNARIFASAIMCVYRIKNEFKEAFANKSNLVLLELYFKEIIQFLENIGEDNFCMGMKVEKVNEENAVMNIIQNHSYYSLNCFVDGNDEIVSEDVSLLYEIYMYVNEEKYRKHYIDKAVYENNVGLIKRVLEELNIKKML